MRYTYSVTLEHIYISPGHNYFGRPKDGPGPHTTPDVAEVMACAGLGLLGDRYYGVAAHFNAQVSFIAAEVLDALADALNLETVAPRLPRRNIVTRGINLNQLIGREFALVANGDVVHLEGAKACSPCAWMDAAIGAGAHAFLRGRGGLRARILTDGTLHRGPVQLQTDFELDTTTLCAPLARPRLP
ncbi:MAG: MOSC domain-containing protein [Litorilinea sp.]